MNIDREANMHVCIAKINISALQFSDSTAMQRVLEDMQKSVLQKYCVQIHDVTQSVGTPLTDYEKPTQKWQRLQLGWAMVGGAVPILQKQLEDILTTIESYGLGETTEQQIEILPF